MEGSRARENQVLARMRSISELRQAEEKANISSEEIEKAKWVKQKQDDDKDDEGVSEWNLSMRKNIS